MSANPAVRAWLFDRQQRLAYSGRMVVEGRDIGTVIAPEADLKIYLTADASERARRRHTQNVGAATGFRWLASWIWPRLPRICTAGIRTTRRDARAAAGGADAVVIDSSSLEVSETVAKVLELAASRGIR